MHSRKIRPRPAFRFFRLALASLFVAGFLATTALGTTVRPPSFEGLVASADCVVHAVVKSVTAEKRVGDRGAKIVTRVQLEILETVAGPVPATLTLELWGGQVGEERMIVDGSPRFSVGDEDILFVRDNGRSICPLVGMMHGRYLVLRDPLLDRKYIARADGTPLQTANEVSRPIGARTFSEGERRVAESTALSPGEFIRQIRATRAVNTRSDHAK